MDKLLNSIYCLVDGLHDAKTEVFAEKAARLDACNSKQLDGYFSTQNTNALLEETIRHWQQVGCSGQEFAALVRATAYTIKLSRDEQSAELVWTGPDLGQIPVRRSEQVLLDLICSAKKTLFIISFVLVKIPDVEVALNNAISRGVDVRLLLESEDAKNSVSFKSTCRRLKDDIPHLKLYIWPREKRLDLGGGFPRVHAKCAIADNNKIFITSANLTSTALGKNMEMGILISGGDLPSQGGDQFMSMIHQNEITEF